MSLKKRYNITLAVLTLINMYIHFKQTTSIKNIEDRLLGNFPKAKGLPLSIEGQVHSLIQVYKHVCE